MELLTDTVTNDALPSVDDVESTFCVTITSRMQHADLLAATEKMGGYQATAQYLGVSTATLSAWINLRSWPNLRSSVYGKRRLKRWPEIERKLFELTGKGPTELFPGFVRLSGVLKAPKVLRQTREVQARDFAALANRTMTALPPPERIVGLTELHEAIQQALKILSSREQKALEIRFGLNGTPVGTLNEVAKHLGVSQERARQILAAALRKLQSSEAVQQNLVTFLNE